MADPGAVVRGGGGSNWSGAFLAIFTAASDHTVLDQPSHGRASGSGGYSAGGNGLKLPAPVTATADGISIRGGGGGYGSEAFLQLTVP